MTAVALYDRIGRTYARHRQPDPRIGAVISDALGDARSVLNVGAGTGSYEPAAGHVVAAEPSRTMIDQRPGWAAPAAQAVAEHLPFRTDAVDASLAVLTIHHWTDWRLGLAEMARVSRRRVLVLGFDSRVHNEFWLIRDYLPHTAARTGSPTVDDVVGALPGTVRVVTVPVPHDCRDGFFAGHWRHPEAYLDPEVRACISNLARAEPASLARGLARLRRDVGDGTWRARYGDLLARDSFDAGMRLVVAETP